VLQRTVYDGAKVTQVQNFSYTTNFFKDTKQTTVTTQDMVTAGQPTSTTIYQYSLIPVEPLPFVGVASGSWNNLTANLIPEEQTISYYDTNGTLLKTVGKTWTGGTPDHMASVTTTQGGETSTVSYTYAAFGHIKEEDDSSLGSGGTAGPLMRKTVNTYASYPLDKPCMSQIEDGSGNLFAETDSYFDGGMTLCGAPGATALNAVSGLPAGTHDETNYGSSSTTARGNVTQITQKCLQGCTSSTTSYSYDETGQMLSMTDGCGNATCADVTGTIHTTYYSYADSPSGANPAGNSNAYVTKVTNPVGYSQYQYNYATGEMSESIDENKQPTTYSYNDPLLRLTDMYGPPVGGVQPHTNSTYVDGTQPSVTSTDPVGVTQKKLFDGLGHLTQTQLQSDPGGTTYVVSTYDGLGRIASTTNPYRSTTDPTYGITQYTYDALGRKILQTQPGGTGTLQWCYDGVASSASQTICSKNASSVANASWVDYADENQHHWQQVSDGLGRLVAAIEPDPATNALALETDYSYDALNNLLSVNQIGSSGATPRTRSFTYDSLSRLLTSTNPETGTICYGQWNSSTCANGYDANGNLQYKTDARGVTTAYSYDALNRVLTKSYSGGNSSVASTPATTYVYDSPSVTNGIGRLATEYTGPASAPITQTSIQVYDPMGRVKQETTLAPSAS
jgi:YD repeat-containing protein